MKPSITSKFKSDYLDQFLTNNRITDINFQSFRGDNEDAYNLGDNYLFLSSREFNSKNNHNKLLTENQSHFKQNILLNKEKINNNIDNNYNTSRTPLPKKNTFHSNKDIKKILTPLGEYNAISGIKKEHNKKLSTKVLFTKKNLSVITGRENMLSSPSKKIITSYSTRKFSSIINNVRDENYKKLNLRNDSNTNLCIKTDINSKYRGSNTNKKINSEKILKKFNSPKIKTISLNNADKIVKITITKDHNSNKTNLKENTSPMGRQLKENFTPSSNNKRNTLNTKRVGNKQVNIRSNTPISINKKIKESEIANNNTSQIKKRIFGEKDIYDIVETIPDKKLFTTNANDQNIDNIRTPKETNFFQEGNINTTLNLCDNPSKVNNTIDTKTDIYQILTYMNGSSNQKSSSNNFQVKIMESKVDLKKANYEYPENTNLPLKIETDKNNLPSQNKNFKNTKHVAFNLIKNDKKEIPFIKNKYKLLLDDYFH